MTKSCFKLLLLVVLLAAGRRAAAQTYSVLYNFNGNSGDGISPSGFLSEDDAGNLYGTTQGGGKNDTGTIFVLSPQGAETILYDFNLPPDAMLPVFGVIRDNSGNLYGSAPEGGQYGTQNGDGAVFKLDTNGTETIIHNFGSGKDGFDTAGGLIRDKSGNLYGTAFDGGKYGWGVIFKINASGKETILYNFNGHSAAGPQGNLLRDAKGNLYGSTIEGGTYGFGTVYKLTPTGTFSVLYNFCALVHCADGSSPMTGLVEDSAGNLYGTTLNGGASLQGTIFKLTPSGKETVLHSFSLAGGDGYFPEAALVSDGAGNFYGTTSVGGAHGTGIIFKISSSGQETILHSFCAETNCADGGQPALGGLLRDSAGNLFGVAGRGAYDAGVVFKLIP